MFFKYWIALWLVTIISSDSKVTNHPTGNQQGRKFGGLSECMLCATTRLNSNEHSLVPHDKDDDSWTRRELWAKSVQHSVWDVSSAINHALSNGASLTSHDKLINQSKSERSNDLHFPIFVIISSHTEDIIITHIESMIRSVGFTGNVSFLPLSDPNTVNYRSDQSPINSCNCVESTDENVVRQHVSEANDHLQAVKTGVDGGFELFGVLEGNLMLAGDPAVIRQRLESGLLSLPSSADMLYLEAEFENCSQRKFSDSYPLWAQSSGPISSGAIIFTRKGAEKILQLSKTVFSSIDYMYAAMISSGLVKAFVSIPHTFFRDEYWSYSCIDRSCGGRSFEAAMHRPSPILCREFATGLVLSIAQISLETPYLRYHHSVESSGWGKVILLSDNLVRSEEAGLRNFSVTYYTKSTRNKLIQVGRWDSNHGYHGVFLKLDWRSQCFYTIDLGTCSVILHIQDDARREKRVSEIQIADLLYVQKDIYGEGDFVVSSFVNIMQVKKNLNSGPSETLGKSAKRVSPSSSANAGSLLTDVHFIFDGIMYRHFSGIMSGITKTWYNIVPWMADLVQSMNGTFSHCQSTLDGQGRLEKIVFPRVNNIPDCENLTESISSLPGHRKIVFSAQGRIAGPVAGYQICNILPFYDLYQGNEDDTSQTGSFVDNAENIPSANGFLSFSDLTTKHLLEMHGIDRSFVSTSPIRVSPLFKRTGDTIDLILTDGFNDKDTITSLLKRKFLLLVDYWPSSRGHQGYDLLWDALQRMPANFSSDVVFHVVGETPWRDIGGMQMSSSADIPEDVMPIIYSKASALIYVLRQAGLNLPPLEAMACGCPVILVALHEEKLRHVFGNDALYAETPEQMVEALSKVFQGEVPAPEILAARAMGYGRDPKHGWNEVAEDFLGYMLRGPFRDIEDSNCSVLVRDEHEVLTQTTDTGFAATEHDISADSSTNYSSMTHNLSPANSTAVFNQCFIEHEDQIFDSSGRCFLTANIPWLIPLATVPRSGTTFVRRVFEAATGIATEAVYPEGGNCKRFVDEPYSLTLHTDCIDEWARPKGSHNYSTVLPYDGEVRECATKFCGCSDKNGDSSFPQFCHASEDDPILFKTHYPFEPSLALAFKDVDASMGSELFPGILLTVRHPVTNYDAFRRFLSDHQKSTSHSPMEYRTFIRKWKAHQEFWIELARRMKKPLVVVRYEDMMRDPHETFTQMFTRLGLDVDLKLSGDSIRNAVDFAIRQHKSLDVFYPKNECVTKPESTNTGIPEYLNEDICGPNVSQDDLAWLALECGPLLYSFGYSVKP